MNIYRERETDTYYIYKQKTCVVYTYIYTYPQSVFPNLNWEDSACRNTLRSPRVVHWPLSHGSNGRDSPVFHPPGFFRFQGIELKQPTRKSEISYPAV